MNRVTAWAVVAVILLSMGGCGTTAAPTATTTPTGTVPPPVPPVFPTAGPLPTASPSPLGPSPVPHMSPLVRRTGEPKAAPTGVAGRPDSTDEPLPPVVPTPEVHVPGAAQLAALQRLSWKYRTRAGQIPGGCATLAGDRICVPSVSVDGKPVSDIVLIAQTFGRRPGPNAVRQAVAEAVFGRLLYLEGRRSGIHATEAQARVLAEGEMAAYVKDPATRSAVPIPPGVPPRKYFLAPETVDAYRVGIIVGRERNAILAAQHGREADVFSAWLRGVLPRHRVSVNGRAPGFSLPNALHVGLSCGGGGGTGC